MDTRTDPRPDSGPLLSADLPAIASLAAELEVLVDRLEADWFERRAVSQELANQLHELRERAEQILGKANN